jgi:hypothetical protein
MPEEEEEEKRDRFEERFRHLEADLKAAHNVLDRSMQIATIRTNFFEKLMLLAAGSFALTLTLLAFLRTHAAPNQPLASLIYLKTAWGLMLASILFGGLHNYFTCENLDKLSYAVGGFSVDVSAARKQVFLANLGRDTSSMKELRVKYRQEVENQSHTADQTQKRASILGILSMCSILSSLVLLLIFTLKNGSLL